MTTGRPLRDEPGRRTVAVSATLHHGIVWDLVRDTVDFAPGVRFDREYVRHTGAVAVLAVDDQDRMLLIRQYRHPVGYTLWELPAGLLDMDGEAPHLAARRELREEAGHDAAAVEALVDVRPSPGGSDEVIRIYLASGVHPAVEEGFERTDEEAELEVRWEQVDDVARAVLAGELTSGVVVPGVLALVARRALAADLRPGDVPWPERPGRD